MDTANLPAYAVRALQAAEALAIMPSKTPVTYTVVKVTPYVPVPCIAPNGSSRGTDYYTTVVVRQDWHDVEECGIYRGRSYRMTETYHSSFEDGSGTMRVSSSSQPWVDGS